jgi:hypothetical protein
VLVDLPADYVHHLARRDDGKIGMGHGDRHVTQPAPVRIAGTKAIGVGKVGLAGFLRAGEIGVATYCNKVPLLSPEHVEGASDHGAAAVHGGERDGWLFPPAVLNGLAFLHGETPVVGGRGVSVGERAPDEMQAVAK